MEQLASHKDIHYELVEGLRIKDRSSQFEVYRLYSRAMLNTSVRIVNDQAEAEDVVQESFVKAFNGIEQFRGDSTFGSWLKRIVVNASLNKLKKQRELSILDDAESQIAEDEPADYAQLSVDQIRQAVAQLPEGFRIVLTLYLFEGYDHKEIAEILGVTESTSKSQYNRAKGKMKVLLKSMYNYER